MSISDVIKTKFIEEFTAISAGGMAVSLLLSFLLGVFIVVIYRLTYSGVTFSKSFALSLVMLAMVTSLAILTVSSNVVLSLGMVGALSIVRFRTAIKDPMDTVFMFWAIVAGIMTGAGYVTVAILAVLGLGLLFLLLNMLSGKYKKNAYVAVIRYAPDAEAEVQSQLHAIGEYKIRSLNNREGELELVAEMTLTEQLLSRVSRIREREGVYEVNLISYNGGTLL